MNEIIKTAVYVTTKAKHDVGSYEGKWLPIADFSNIGEFLTACRYWHKDEYDPEFYYARWPHVPFGLITEEWIDKKLFPLVRQCLSLSGEHRYAYTIWLNAHREETIEKEPEELMNQFLFDYQGQYDYPIDFTFSYLKDNMGIAPENYPFFDYKKYAQNLFKNEFVLKKGHVFKRSKTGDFSFE